MLLFIKQLLWCKDSSKLVAIMQEVIIIFQEHTKLQRALSDLEDCRKKIRVQSAKSYDKVKEEMKKINMENGPEENMSRTLLLVKQKDDYKQIIEKCKDFSNKVKEEVEESNMNVLQRLGKKQRIDVRSLPLSNSPNCLFEPISCWESPDEGVFKNQQMKRVTFNNGYDEWNNDSTDEVCPPDIFSFFLSSRRGSAGDVHKQNIESRQERGRSGSVCNISASSLSRRGSCNGSYIGGRSGTMSESSFGTNMTGTVKMKTQTQTKNSESRMIQRRSTNANLLKYMGRTVSDEARQQILSLELSR